MKFNELYQLGFPHLNWNESTNKSLFKYFPLDRTRSHKFFLLSMVLPHFINTFQLIGDQFHLLYWSHSYDRNYLIDLIDKLGRVFLNFRAMKLWRAHPHEVLYHGSRRTHIWVNRDNHFFMGLVRHNSIEHFKSQSKLAFVTCLSKRSIRY